MPAALRRVLLATGLALVPAAAAAHPGGAHGQDGVVSGFLHPLTGADHLAAMVAVGLWAALLGGRATIAVPAAFVALLAAGAAAGAAGLPVPAVEPMIAASVIAIGLATALAFRVPTALAAAVVAVFALFHGAAHGAEMPAAALPLAWAAGLLAATVLLFVAGLVGGVLLAGRDGRLLRTAGAGLAAVGVLLAAG